MLTLYSNIVPMGFGVGGGAHDSLQSTCVCVPWASAVHVLVFSSQRNIGFGVGGGVGFGVGGGVGGSVGGGVGFGVGGGISSVW